MSMSRNLARTIILACVRDVGPGYHPDSRFEDYVDKDGRALGRRTDFTWPCTQEEHDKAMRVLGDEAYEIGLAEQTKLYFNRANRPRRMENAKKQDLP